LSYYRRRSNESAAVIVLVFLGGVFLYRIYKEFPTRTWLLDHMYDWQFRVAIAVVCSIGVFWLSKKAYRYFYRHKEQSLSPIKTSAILNNKTSSPTYQLDESDLSFNELLNNLKLVDAYTFEKIVTHAFTFRGYKALEFGGSPSTNSM
jgi:hypothetical protein